MSNPKDKSDELAAAFSDALKPYLIGGMMPRHDAVFFVMNESTALMIGHSCWDYIQNQYCGLPITSIFGYHVVEDNTLKHGIVGVHSYDQLTTPTFSIAHLLRNPHETMCFPQEDTHDTD